MLNLELLIPFWKVIIFSKKQIVPFATSGGSGISNVVENLKAHYPELNFADGRLLNNYID